MSIEFQSHAHLHQLGEYPQGAGRGCKAAKAATTPLNATHPIARFSGRLAALLFVAGSSHAPHRALPDNPKTAHSNASNYGF